MILYKDSLDYSITIKIIYNPKIGWNNQWFGHSNSDNTYRIIQHCRQVDFDEANGTIVIYCKDAPNITFDIRNVLYIFNRSESPNKRIYDYLNWWHKYHKVFN